ncbi:acylphosphatase [Acuticoccus sp. MNP-M23]|uniref:acylphosphatase n=1 Tax=Acuticoccus sp. MNP-M23 TaxID=3072793 RepID=UPI002815CA65|nr:acylphosphatase [Acuticoccus sp. MNP-M23]WMS40868.1 acylphosphatase [Acuticoccus sp. MNP-M23]
MMATRFLISGHVQGVGYRDWCRREAEDRGLAGYVRNLADGRVEALFYGRNEVVDEMLVACRKGPPGAAVTSVGLDAVDLPPVEGFTILRDA